MCNYRNSRLFLFGLMIIGALIIGYFEPARKVALGQGTVPVTATPVIEITDTPTDMPSTPTPIPPQSTSTPAPINGPDVPCAINPWRLTTNMTTKHSYHGTAIYNAFIYTVGGWNHRIVEKAHINDNGTLGLWQRESSISGLHQDLALIAYDGYLYALGGYNSYSSVEYAKINSNGSLGDWHFTSSLTIGRSQLSGFATHGYIYAIGGDGQIPSTVERAKVNDDGSLGEWKLVNSMVYGHQSRHTVMINGSVYVIGLGSPSENLNSIERAQVNSDGSLGAWQVVGSLSEDRSDYTVAADDKAIYVIGGYQNNNVTKITINADGTLAQPVRVVPLHFQRGGATALIHAGDIYVVGGHEYTSPISEESVEWAHIEDLDIPRNFGLSINDGSLFVNQTTVTLHISGETNSVEMQVSNDGGFSGSVWEPCRATKDWQITSFGSSILPRTVYARFRDHLGTVSNIFQDDIILDNTAPTGSIQVEPLNIAISQRSSSSTNLTIPQANNAVYLPLVSAGPANCPATGTPNVTLQLSAQDDISGVGQMMISNDSKFTCATWQLYNTLQNWFVPTGSTITVYVRFRDNASNISEIASDSVTLP